MPRRRRTSHNLIRAGVSEMKAMTIRQLHNRQTATATRTHLRSWQAVPMRRWLPLLTSCYVALLSSCGRQSPLAPVVDRDTSREESTPLVIASALDPRLPMLLAEAEGVPPGEGVAIANSDRAQEEHPRPPDNPAVFWSDRCTDYGLAARLAPPLMARAYALTQVAIYDALLASGHPRRSGLPDGATAAGAASKVLTYLFPADSSAIMAAALAEAELNGPPGNQARRAWFLGRAVGQLVVIYGRNDRSDTPWDGSMPTGEGIWTGANPILPMCGTWKTWLTSSGAEFQPEPPYAYGSPEDLADVNAVYQTSLHRTPEQIAIVHKWADLPPPTIWCGLLNDEIRLHHLETFDSARAHAFLNATMYDAFVSCWRTKYRYWTARPFQRIPALATVIPTPNFPTYTSGHSTISGAAAQVMSALFPAEALYFEEQANEAAMSRLWGGIHFPHDNDAGLSVGRQIGAKAVQAMLRDANDLIATR
jgi:hypothetical protein